jgi:hypothetical protein
MKGAEDGAMEVHDLDIDIGQFVGVRNPDFAFGISELFRFDGKVIVEDLLWSDTGRPKGVD